MSKISSSFGKNAENDACKLLLAKGYKIIDRNFRSLFGEIDIIAEFQNSLIFIEVKARQNLKYGSPEEAVTKSKLDKIVKTANYFLLKHPNSHKKMHIEVVAIQYLEGVMANCKVIKVY